MRNFVKKTFQFLASRMLYLFVGLFFAFSIFVAQAAWNTVVNSGDQLRSTDWNSLIAQIETLQTNQAAMVASAIAVDADNRLDTLEGASVSLPQPATCDWVVTNTCGHSCGTSQYFEAICPVGQYVAGHSLRTWNQYATYEHGVYCCPTN